LQERIFSRRDVKEELEGQIVKGVENDICHEIELRANIPDVEQCRLREK
jgi:hypothetical protein